MAMQPSALILDEPTSQLDPIAASEFLATIGKINRELGVTVIMTEHRLEEVFTLCDRAVVMDGGTITAAGSPREIGVALRGEGHGMFLAMPSAMRIWAACGGEGECPVTVRDGAAWIARAAAAGAIKEKPSAPAAARPGGQEAVRLDDVWFKYGKDEPDVVRGLSFSAFPGEMFALLGGNGAGKTTALSLMSGLNTPYRGKVLINGGKIGEISGLFDGLLGVLPQNPQTIFVRKTVREDLLEILSEMKLQKDEKQERLGRMAALCRLDGLLDSHPYDLSGGEQQRAALAKVLLLRPSILLLDEPTKGLDAQFKRSFAGILKKLTAAGAAVVVVSHDVEFCAEYADRCALFFDGAIVSEGESGVFFAGNNFYTTSASRMARRFLPRAVTVRDVADALGGDAPAPPVPEDGEGGARYVIPTAGARAKPPSGGQKLLPRRRAAAGLSSLALLAAIAYIARNFTAFRAFVSGGNIALEVTAGEDALKTYVLPLLFLTLSAISLTLALTWKRREAPFITRAVPGKRGLSKRTVASAVMILLLIPLTIFVGYYYLGDRKYYFISLLIILETMLPFALVFESRKPQARELVVIAALCAIAVAGRAAFFMLPQFKPVVALVIITGVAFGGEAGFLVGAMTAIVSNMFFTQGPWTPWQMFAFGIIGFIAGVLFRKGIISRGRVALSVFGALAAFVIYGGVMNPAMVLMYQSAPTKALIFAAYLQGIPFDLVHAAATVLFMLLISQPMLEKLDRIKTKYGLVE
jgi:energy-coupling factor transport system ATP-binding protein